MNKIISKLKNRAGMSILEVLIALFLAGIVTTAIFKIYITQHKNWMIQEDVTDIQQNARAAIDELNRNIRMAGHALPFGLNAIEAYDTNPDTIIVNYYDNSCDVSVEQPMANPASDIKCDGHDVSCFYSGQWIYIDDPSAGNGEFFAISTILSGSSTIQHSSALSKSYAIGSKIMSISQIKYFIDNSDSLHPNLMMESPGQKPQIYAENIDNLQFRYTMKNGITTDSPVISANIREVEILISARSDKPDVDFPDDPYRRRTYSSKVNLRNLDI
ncbi:MAG: hypothetical protein GY865_07135 [candidate division Zixibacteria bacterium]|nr:hypothetical protein [candidate division Zixibacteria bacterium]